MRIRRIVTVAVVLFSGLVLLPPVGAQVTTQAVQAVDVDLVGDAAWVTWSNGRVEAWPLEGKQVTPPPRPALPVFLGAGESAVALVPTEGGYWLFTSTGRVIAAGTAGFHGDLSAFTLNDPIVAAAPTVSGEGYYMLGADGGVFTFGDALFYGSVQGIVDEAIGHGALASDHLTAPIVTLATTPAGYWLVAADGAVFPFGDAPYHGSLQDAINTGNQLAGITREWTVTPPVAKGALPARKALAAPIVDIVPSAAGAGYLMLASDGGIFNFGQSQFHGSLAGEAGSPATGSDVTPSRDGYIIVTEHGVIHGFGSLPDSSMPGEGVTVRMARANWSTGYFQAEVYKQLLEELGYTVTDPANLEFGPDVAYRAMAQGDFDFWANGWYPAHWRWLANRLSDGSRIDDHVSPVGAQMLAGGSQGFLIEKKFADKHGIKTLDDLNNNAEAIAEYDAGDMRPGNGMVDILGCWPNWSCGEIIDSIIAFSGWKNIAQVRGNYDLMFAQAVSGLEDGTPFVFYTWTPSPYITELIPGSNVYWLGTKSVLDDSNPLGLTGGGEWDQRPGTARLDAGQCPAAADHPFGLCPIGWQVNDILVTARDDFLLANPPAKQLLEDVSLSVLDVSLANLAQENDEDLSALAAQWIADNRFTVSGWLNAARAAAGSGT